VLWGWAIRYIRCEQQKKTNADRHVRWCDQPREGGTTPKRFCPVALRLFIIFSFLQSSSHVKADGWWRFSKRKKKRPWCLILCRPNWKTRGAVHSTADLIDIVLSLRNAPPSSDNSRFYSQSRYSTWQLRSTLNYCGFRSAAKVNNDFSPLQRHSSG